MRRLLANNKRDADRSAAQFRKNKTPASKGDLDGICHALGQEMALEAALQARIFRKAVHELETQIERLRDHIARVEAQLEKITPSSTATDKATNGSGVETATH